MHTVAFVFEKNDVPLFWIHAVACFFRVLSLLSWQATKSYKPTKVRRAMVTPPNVLCIDSGLESPYDEGARLYRKPRPRPARGAAAAAGDGSGGDGRRDGSDDGSAGAGNGSGSNSGGGGGEGNRGVVNCKVCCVFCGWRVCCCGVAALVNVFLGLVRSRAAVAFVLLW